MLVFFSRDELDMLAIWNKTAHALGRLISLAELNDFWFFEFAKINIWFLHRKRFESTVWRIKEVEIYLFRYGLFSNSNHSIDGSCTFQMYEFQNVNSEHMYKCSVWIQISIDYIMSSTHVIFPVSYLTFCLLPVFIWHCNFSSPQTFTFMVNSFPQRNRIWNDRLNEWWLNAFIQL